MNQVQLKNNSELHSFFEVASKEIEEKAVIEARKVAREITQKALDFMDFQIFLNSFPKEDWEQASKDVADIRNGKGVLSKKEISKLEDEF